MRRARRSSTRTVVLSLGRAGLVLIALLAAGSASAEPRGETRQTNGKLVAYDAAAQTITVKEKGREQVYEVKAEGSVLTRTTVTMNASPAKMADLQPGMIVIVYWKPDAADADRRVARKIDVPRIPREFQEDVEQANP